MKAKSVSSVLKTKCGREIHRERERDCVCVIEWDSGYIMHVSKIITRHGAPHLLHPISPNTPRC